MIVPVRDGARFVPTCLRSIGADPYPDGYREILVADNGSTDGTVALAESLGARVLSKPGVPVSALRNEAVKASSGDVLAFIDVDHEIDGGWLSAALDALRDPSVAAAGAPCHPPRNATWVQTMYDAMRDHVASPVETRWLGAGNLVVKRKAFEGVGGFDATLEACEDVDLCQRLRRSGARLVNTPHMVNRHFGDPATLAALFRGELWRGRDNLRVSLRGPMAWRDLPSIGVPALWLLVTALAVTALSSGSTLLAGLAAAGFGLLVVASGSRAAGMIRRRRLRPGVQWAQSLIVATVYDVARALSLVVRAGHRTRQTGSA